MLLRSPRYHTGPMTDPTPALIDLHTHSVHSDGVLTPTELVQLAQQRGVGTLALTDHDSTAGLNEAREACDAVGMRLINGVEITCGWRGQELHVVGLGIDPENAALKSHLESLIKLRRERCLAIGDRLKRVPKLAAFDLGAEVVRDAAVPTRTHLARALVRTGVAETTQAAFDRYLARGQAGYVPSQWPALDVTIHAIRAAGGHAVLAHPQRYKLSSGGLRGLCQEFAVFGGAALETSLPGMAPDVADRLASLARSNDLAGSAGSDFHEPGLPWRPLGRFAKLAADLEPVWLRLT